MSLLCKKNSVSVQKRAFKNVYYHNLTASRAKAETSEPRSPFHTVTNSNVLLAQTEKLDHNAAQKTDERCLTQN